MVSLRTFVAFALLAYSDALPSNREQSKAFSIKQVPRSLEDTVPRNGPEAYARALAKYGASTAHIDIVARAAVSASGDVAGTPPSYADVEYDCPVTIGSQTFKLDLDTGSSDTWVLGTGSGAASSHTMYSPGSTAKLQSGQSWKIGYGDGSSASGAVYNDIVKFGNTVVTNQAIEMASTASSGFTVSSRPSDGLLGLAFDSLNTVRPKQQLTFFTNAINQGLPQKLFTVRLKKGQAGTYNFGAINSNEYTGAITYTPVDNSQGFWAFTPTGYQVGSSNVVTPSSTSIVKGIADTGTTLLLLDQSIVTAYYNQVSGSAYVKAFGGYVFPCASSLPNLSFVISGYKAAVPGNYMSYARANTTHCYGGLQSNSGIGFNIYGDIFLKSQFVVFDRTQSTPRLGFATAR